MIEATTSAGGRSRPERFASRYSRFVDLMKFLLPATALLLIAIVALWPQLTGGYGSLIMPLLTRDGVDAGDAMRMHQPRYSGLTEAEESYQLVANAAIIDPARPNRIRLEDLVADLDRNDAGDLHLTARSGIYFRAIEKLKLAGNIELTTSDGYRFTTQSAEISLARGRVVGDEPVAGSGPAGTLQADRFEIRDGGDVLRFEGRVKVVTQPRRPDGAAS
jgi:lipopolysaccharide export system protein LptC